MSLLKLHLFVDEKLCLEIEIIKHQQVLSIICFEEHNFLTILQNSKAN